MLIRAVHKDNENHKEWVFCRGLSAYKTGQKAIEQDIETALYEFTNDCYFALNNGINWLVRLGYHNQKELLDSDIYNTIENRYGVLSISYFTSNVYNRAYQCNCKVYTIFSEDFIDLNFSIEV